MPVWLDIVGLIMKKWPRLSKIEDVNPINNSLQVKNPRPEDVASLEAPCPAISGLLKWNSKCKVSMPLRWELAR
jgi:hypothetical protein